MSASSSLGAGAGKRRERPVAYKAADSNVAGSDVLKSLVRVKDKDCIFLDKVAPLSYVLTNSLTGEKKVLIPGDWSTEADDDGDLVAFRVPASEEEEAIVLLPDDMFKWRVYRHPTGENFYQTGDGRVQSLDSVKTKHTTAEVTVKSSATSATFAAEVFVFHHPRYANQNMFWGMPQLYSILSMSSYQNKRSVWVAKSWTRWQQFLQVAIGACCFIHSNHGNAKSGESSGDWVDRCLPMMCVSTVGLLLLIMRWAFASREVGGLVEPGSRKAAEEFFLALVGPFASVAEPLELRLELVQEFRPRHPRPQPHDSTYCVVIIQPDKMLDLQKLHDMGVGRGRNPIAGEWWREIKKLTSARLPTELSLNDIFRLCSGSQVLLPMLAQVLWHLSLRVEKILGKQAKGEKEKETTTTDQDIPLHFRWKGKEETFEENLESHLAEYVLSAVEASAGYNSISLATDKASINGLPLQNTLMVLPSGVAIVGIPQVDYGHDMQEDVAEQGLKRNAKGEVVKGSALNERHRSWLQRGRQGAQSESWRPTRHFRLSAKHWLIHTDAQLRHGTSFNGWKYFQKDETWRDDQWRVWPHITVSLDQGGDGLSGTFALEYMFGVNMLRVCDFAHGAHKDLQAGLKDAHLFDFILLAMISANVMHGPDKDDQRFHQVREAMRGAYSRLSERNPLFAELAPAIHAEISKSGYDWPREESLEVETWKYAKAQDPFTKKNYRLNLNRFMGLIEVGSEYMLPRWSLDLWERTFVCLEGDMLRGNAVKQLVLRPAEAETFDEKGIGSTASDRITVEDRTLRSCLQNALVISTMFLQDGLNRRRMEVIMGVGKRLRAWHVEQSKTLRSIDGSTSWAAEQVGNAKFFDHVNNILAATTDEDLLVSAGFTLVCNEGAPNINDLQSLDDEVAATVGMFSLALAFARMRRCLWLVAGWPCMMAKALIPEKAPEVTKLFLDDLQLFEELSAFEGKVASDKQLVGRHAMNLVACKQFAAGLRETEGVATPDFCKVVEQRFKGGLGTQVVEDMNGIQKNASEIKGTNRYRKPQRAMGKTILSNLVDVRHEYRTVPSMASIPRDHRLPPSAWRSPPDEWSLEFGKVVSTSQSAPYYSPSASNLCTRDADLQLIRDAKAAGGYRNLRNAWLGELFATLNQIVFTLKDPCTGIVGWFVAGHAFPNSSVLVLPVDPVAILGTSDVFLQPKQLTAPKLVSIFDLRTDAIKGACFVWKSWVSEFMAYLEARHVLAPAVRMIVRDPLEPIRTLAAKNAFWSASRATVVKFSNYWGANVAAGSTEFDIIVQASQNITGCDIDASLAIAHRRMISLTRETALSQELATIDAAIETFDRSDHEQVQGEKKRVRDLVEERREYTAHYTSRKKERNQELKKASGKRAKKGELQYSALPRSIEQQDAKRYIPPGSSIWRGLQRGEWAGHMHSYGYPRVSARLSELGDQGALRAVLQKLWRQWLEYNGKPESECPVPGVFGGEGVGDGGAAAISSSSRSARASK